VQGKLTPKPAVDVTVDAPWVKDHLNDPSIRLVDVRSEREWEGGMIPNAGPLLWRELFADPSAGRFKTPDQIRALFARAGVGADQTAVTYCAIGMRASLAYFAARLAGLPARVYQGSMSDWAGRPGYPLVRK
jgi:3-mercaptopyruvate sulfurtransferase SseA